MAWRSGQLGCYSSTSQKPSGHQAKYPHLHTCSTTSHRQQATQATDVPSRCAECADMTLLQPTPGEKANRFLFATAQVGKPGEGPVWMAVDCPCIVALTPLLSGSAGGFIEVGLECRVSARSSLFSHIYVTSPFWFSVPPTATLLPHGDRTWCCTRNDGMCSFDGHRAPMSKIISAHTCAVRPSVGPSTVRNCDRPTVRSTDGPTETPVRPPVRPPRPPTALSDVRPGALLTVRLSDRRAHVVFCAGARKCQGRVASNQRWWPFDGVGLGA